MKKTIIVLFLLFTAGSLFSAKTAYQLFIEEWKNKNYEKALEYIKTAYNEDPSKDYLPYWYGLTLVTLKRHEEAIPVLKKVPDSYYPLTTRWYLASSLKETGQIKEAIEVLLDSFHYPEKDNDKKIFVYQLFTDIAAKEKQTDLLLSHEDEILGYISSHPSDSADWIKYLFVKTYYDAGIEKAHKINEAFDFFEKSDRILSSGLGKYAIYFERGNLEIIVRALHFFEENPVPDDLPVHRILVVFAKETKAFFQDKKYEYQMNQEDIQKYLPVFELFRKIYYYYTAGKYDFSFEYEWIDSSVVDLKTIEWKSKNNEETHMILQPELNTMKNFPTRLYYSKRNDFDTFVFVYPFEETHIPYGKNGYYSLGFGGKTPLILTPYFLTSEKMRGGITLTTSVLNLPILVHEFFHNVEGAFEGLTTHVFRPAYKKIWPSWYHGEGELKYYNLAFQNIIRKQKIENLNFKKESDLTPYEYLEKSKELSQNYPEEKLKKAYSFFQDAWTAYRESRYQEALTLFEKTYSLAPFFIRLNELLGYLYYQKKDYKSSLKHYELEYSLYPQNNFFLPTLAYLYRLEKENQKAVQIYRKILEGNPNEIVYLYYIGIVYYEQKDYYETLNYFYQYGEKEKDYSRTEFLSALEITAYILCQVEKNYSTALTFLKKYETVFQNKPNTLIYFAIALGETGKQKEAYQLLLKVKKLGYAYEDFLSYYLKKYKPK
ncbi:MAG TPA: hypothetical protein DHW82_13930 [Spirochaetia bacterium]|nr:MAG: hypothetical protein A2Y41_10020 [Spirochaetes bacterium GWB1_36_13]HCL58088.1 hypothetical protein [Spirochaetia bacterium]